MPLPPVGDALRASTYPLPPVLSVADLIPLSPDMETEWVSLSSVWFAAETVIVIKSVAVYNKVFDTVPS